MKRAIKVASQSLGTVSTIEGGRKSSSSLRPSAVADRYVTPAPIPELDDECASCGEQMPANECPKSKRPSGHHCNHSWTHDACDWCGKEFGEESPAPIPAEVLDEWVKVLVNVVWDTERESDIAIATGPWHFDYEAVLKRNITAVLPRVIAATKHAVWAEGYVTGHRQACRGRCTRGVARNPYPKGSE